MLVLFRKQLKLRRRKKREIKIYCLSKLSEIFMVIVQLFLPRELCFLRHQLRFIPRILSWERVGIKDNRERKEKEKIYYGEREDRLQRKELKITEKGKKDYMHFLFSSYFKK